MPLRIACIRCINRRQGSGVLRRLPIRDLRFENRNWKTFSPLISNLESRTSNRLGLGASFGFELAETLLEDRRDRGASDGCSAAYKSVNGFGSPVPLGHCINHGCRAQNGVAAGKNPFYACRQSVLVGKNPAARACFQSETKRSTARPEVRMTVSAGMLEVAESSNRGSNLLNSSKALVHARKVTAVALPSAASILVGPRP